ncbi:hypothetical protein ACTPOK_41055 [Streptomyces inhibens]|uniref:hypothetical protein n=1 Tax=Streptomyces inhibens TaxID=2293571 RepID=UPI00402A9286
MCTNSATKYARKHSPWFAFDNVPLNTAHTFSQFPTNYSMLLVTFDEGDRSLPQQPHRHGAVRSARRPGQLVQVIDLMGRLEERDEELRAARAADRQLINSLNTPALRKREARQGAPTGAGALVVCLLRMLS